MVQDEFRRQLPVGQGRPTTPALSAQWPGSTSDRPVRQARYSNLAARCGTSRVSHCPRRYHIGTTLPLVHPPTYRPPRHHKYPSRNSSTGWHRLDTPLSFNWQVASGATMSDAHLHGFPRMLYTSGVVRTRSFLLLPPHPPSPVPHNRASILLPTSLIFSSFEAPYPY